MNSAASYNPLTVPTAPLIESQTDQQVPFQQQQYPIQSAQYQGPAYSEYQPPQYQQNYNQSTPIFAQQTVEDNNTLNVKYNKIFIILFALGFLFVVPWLAGFIISRKTTNKTVRVLGWVSLLLFWVVGVILCFIPAMII
ncbi:hypothetical protein EIN_426610 [Entamoeba invadens IP1]|uniref:Uncharacterized protein n=1 Tax=Entamoeba invadens IP1 TaxID=370355 RepID=A0A0A1UC06_ENTIV|nr:hypothetical protein EIN_426610 [Entamoeba invadens IP1]ELP89829.1 hypothetical protein EIN_426610 [Entamoeba invadens IP1]|eukprot:XP_004256600.1 hypothetical protein EIN_426610 [Entamoeba invadens IP1]